jgi:hypothetical protein
MVGLNARQCYGTAPKKLTQPTYTTSPAIYHYR